MSPRKILGSLAAALTMIQAVPSALAQDSYPSRPIKMILPFASGGQSDVVARLIAGSVESEHLLALLTSTARPALRRSHEV